MLSEHPPLIVVLALDPESFAVLDGLRRRHFPPERNVVPAHVTLFHHLPGADEQAVADVLRREAEACAPFAFRAAAPVFTGRGVALRFEAEGLPALRARLAAAFAASLGPQDRQPFRPHVTIQNKAPPAEARRLQAELLGAQPAIVGTAIGLDLHRYRGGPWEAVERLPFRGRPANAALT